MKHKPLFISVSKEYSPFLDRLLTAIRLASRVNVATLEGRRVILNFKDVISMTERFENELSEVIKEPDKVQIVGLSPDIRNWLHR